IPADCPGGSCGGTKTCVGGPYNGLTCTTGPAGNEGRPCGGCDPARICTSAGVPFACCTGSGTGPTCPLVGSCAIVPSAFAVPVAARREIYCACSAPGGPPGDGRCTTNGQFHTRRGGGNSGLPCVTDTNCPSGTCSGSGTCQLAKLDLVPGAQDGNGERPLTI